MLSIKQAKFALKIIIPIFAAILSIFVLSVKFPQTRYVKSTVDSIEDSKTTVLEFTGATLAASLAISALPDDFASPLANTLADMDKYFVLILMVLFFERLIVVEGTSIAFALIIPAACILYAMGNLIRKKVLVKFAYKVMILAAAIILVIPCSTYFTKVVGADYLAYVDETISETKSGSDKINEIMTTTDEDATLFEKLSNAFKTAMDGIKDLLAYFNTMIKKCMNSIAILIVTTIVIPLMTLLFFKWLLKELFQINISVPDFKKNPFVKKGKGKDDDSNDGEDEE